MRATTGLLVSMPAITVADVSLGEEAEPHYIRKRLDGQECSCGLTVLVCPDLHHQKRRLPNPKMSEPDIPHNCELGGDDCSPYLTLDWEPGDLLCQQQQKSLISSPQVAEIMSFNNGGNFRLREWPSRLSTDITDTA